MKKIIFTTILFCLIYTFCLAQNEYINYYDYLTQPHILIKQEAYGFDTIAIDKFTKKHSITPKIIKLTTSSESAIFIRFDTFHLNSKNRAANYLSLEEFLLVKTTLTKIIEITKQSPQQSSEYIFTTMSGFVIKSFYYQKKDEYTLEINLIIDFNDPETNKLSLNQNDIDKLIELFNHIEQKAKNI